MSNDALSKFISGLDTIDPRNLGAPANRAALERFQGYDSGTQKQIINDLASKFGLTGEQATSMSEADSRRVVQNMQSGRPPLEGVTLPSIQQQPVQPSAPAPQPLPVQQQQRDPNAPDTRTFSQKWADVQAKQQPKEAYMAGSDTEKARAERYGEEHAKATHGYVAPAVQAQRDRIASIQAEAKQTGKTFSEVADARVAAGQ